MILTLLLAFVFAVSGPSESSPSQSGNAASMSEDQTLYGDDETHPIPFLQALDAFAVKTGGGSSSVIIIAQPLRADERSQRRMLRKIENYLGFITSEEHRQEAGPPSPEKTEILVSIDRRSDPEIFELLEQCGPWTLENGVSLRVERK